MILSIGYSIAAQNFDQIWATFESQAIGDQQLLFPLCLLCASLAESPCSDAHGWVTLALIG